MSLRIPLSVVRWKAPANDRRVRYQHGDRQLIPEEVVLQRWKERSKEQSALASGVRFDGCRLPPGTWGLLRSWFDAGLRRQDAVRADVLQQYADRSRAAGVKLKAPHSSKFAAVISFLEDRKVLMPVVNRRRDAAAPGIPDLFLYRVDRHDRIHGGRFVEVKRWNRTKKTRERVSPQQKDELTFLRGLNLAAQVVYLMEG
jgi:hypothetical protein